MYKFERSITERPFRIRPMKIFSQIKSGKFVWNWIQVNLSEKYAIKSIIISFQNINENLILIESNNDVTFKQYIKITFKITTRKK